MSKELTVMFCDPMRVLRQAICLTCFVGLCGPWANAEDATYLLRYKFQPGQVFYYEVENSMRMVTRYQQASEDHANQSQAWKQLRVIAVDEQGVATIEPIIERVIMKSSKGGEDPIVYDSATDANPSFQFLEVKKTIGQVQARMSFGPTGELKQVIPLSNENEQFKFAAQRNDPQLNFLTVMPQQPIRVGESWKDRFKAAVTVERKLQQEVDLQRTYTLESVKGSLATIKLKTSVITPISDPQIEVQLIQRTPAGTIEFDLEKGLLLGLNTKIDQTVVGAFGQQSSMSAVTKCMEKLLPERPNFNLVAKPGEATK